MFIFNQTWRKRRGEKKNLFFLFVKCYWENQKKIKKKKKRNTKKRKSKFLSNWMPTKKKIRIKEKKLCYIIVQKCSRHCMQCKGSHPRPWSSCRSGPWWKRTAVWSCLQTKRWPSRTAAGSACVWSTWIELLICHWVQETFACQSRVSASWQRVPPQP